MPAAVPATGYGVSGVLVSDDDAPDSVPPDASDPALRRAASFAAAGWNDPGLASLKAAAKPANKKYLFYVRKDNSKSGEHAFSSTDAQFARDLARYNASREGQ